MKPRPSIHEVDRILRAVEDAAGLKDHDMRTRAVLRLIGERESEGRPFFVKELINLRRLGTAPTIFNRIAVLERSGWIRRVPDEADRRAKRLHLTPGSSEMYRLVSRRLYELFRA